MTTIYQEVMVAEELFDLCFDRETGEINEADLAWVEEQKKLIIEEGLEKLCKVHTNKKALVETLKAEEKRLSDKRKSEEKRIERLEEYIMLIHKASGHEKSIAGTFTVSTRKSTQVIISEDFDDIDYQTIEEVKKIDKLKIKKDLQNGVLILGAHLQANENLSVK